MCMVEKQQRSQYSYVCQRKTEPQYNLLADYINCTEFLLRSCLIRAHLLTMTVSFPMDKIPRRP